MVVISPTVRRDKGLSFVCFVIGREEKRSKLYCQLYSVTGTVIGQFIRKMYVFRILYTQKYIIYLIHIYNPILFTVLKIINRKFVLLHKTVNTVNQ